MNWFLRLFPQYREAMRMLREEADRSIKMQDQNDILVRQNVKLEEQIEEARTAQVYALKSIANINIQAQGGLPMYREAYTLEPREIGQEPGPVESHYIQGRDLVRSSAQNFHQQLRDWEEKRAANGGR